MAEVQYLQFDESERQDQLNQSQNNNEQFPSVSQQIEIEPIKENDQPTWFQRITCRGKPNTSEAEVVTKQQEVNPEQEEKKPEDGAEQPEGGEQKPADNEADDNSDRPPQPDADKPVEEVKPKSTDPTLIQQLDTLVLATAPFWLTLFYYGAFGSNLYLAYYLEVFESSSCAIYIVVILAINQFIRICFWYSLEDEWRNQLPYRDSELTNTARLYAIFIASALNLDTPYWLYLVYWTKDRRDGEIEYILCLSRTVQIIFEHIPILYISTYLLIEGDTINLIIISAITFNLLQSVALMYNVNFFNGNSIDVIKWCSLRTFEMWSKASIFCFALNLLSDDDKVLSLIALFASVVFVSAIWFVFLSEFKEETLMGGIVTYTIILTKIYSIFAFKDTNYGFSFRFESDAQPKIYDMKVNKKTNVILAYTINFMFYLQVAHICALLHGQETHESSPFLKTIIGSGAVCFSIVTLYYCFFLSYYPRDYSNRSPDRDDEAEPE